MTAIFISIEMLLCFLSSLITNLHKNVYKCNDYSPIIHNFVTKKKVMKSLLFIFTVASLFMCVTSCNNGNNPNTLTESEEVKEEQQVEDPQAVEEEGAEATDAVEDELVIQNFITNMYEKYLYSESDFIEKHCSKALQQYLKDQYEYDGEGYAFWLFRTSSTDGKPGAESTKSEIISVTKDHEGWYHYTFTDGGWHGENKIKLHMENGKVVMDELQRVYDEAAIEYNN